MRQCVLVWGLGGVRSTLRAHKCRKFIDSLTRICAFFDRTRTHVPCTILYMFINGVMFSYTRSRTQTHSRSRSVRIGSCARKHCQFSACFTLARSRPQKTQTAPYYKAQPCSVAANMLAYKSGCNYYDHLWASSGDPIRSPMTTAHCFAPHDRSQRATASIAPRCLHGAGRGAYATQRVVRILDYIMNKTRMNFHIYAHARVPCTCAACTYEWLGVLDISQLACHTQNNARRPKTIGSKKQQRQLAGILWLPDGFNLYIPWSIDR